MIFFQLIRVLLYFTFSLVYSSPKQVIAPHFQWLVWVDLDTLERYVLWKISSHNELPRTLDIHPHFLSKILITYLTSDTFHLSMFSHNILGNISSLQGGIYFPLQGLPPHCILATISLQYIRFQTHPLPVHSTDWIYI